jgi:hypothetical protein
MKNLITLLVLLFTTTSYGTKFRIKMDQISKEDQVKMAQWYVDVTEKELCKLKIQLYLVRNLLR